MIDDHHGGNHGHPRGPEVCSRRRHPAGHPECRYRDPPRLFERRWSRESGPSALDPTVLALYFPCFLESLRRMGERYNLHEELLCPQQVLSVLTRKEYEQSVWETGMMGQ